MKMIATVTTLRRFPAEVRVLSSYEEVSAKRAEFEAKVANGTASRVDLIWYILTIDEAGYETIPQSMGMNWIHRNPLEFARIVGDVGDFLEEVLGLAEINPMNEGEDDVKAWDGLHGLRYWFLRSFPLSNELMRLLTPGWREIVVRDIYPKVGAHNNCWISAAILGGVQREMIAMAILKRLKRAKIVKGMANDVDDFLRHGGGHDRDAAPVHAALWSLAIDRDRMDNLRDAIRHDPSAGFHEIERRLREGTIPRTTAFGVFPKIPPWFVLSNEELAEALQTCATKEPAKTLQILRDERIVSRLQNVDTYSIVTMAFRRMDTIAGVSRETLEHLLDRTDREALARQLRPVEEHYLHKATAQFLFKIICELSPFEARKRFWYDVVVPVLKPASAATVYKAWRQMKLEEDDIETELRSWLEEDGYILGTICKSAHPKGGTQWFVEARGVRFVKDKNDHRYFPTAEELVLFKPETGRVLTPRVIAVNFNPVMKDVD